LSTLRDGDHRLIAQLPRRSSRKKDIAVFGNRREEDAGADPGFPS